MEEKIKNILSVFIKTPADQINAATPIDRKAVKSSILLHRMYARLAEEGIVVAQYADINNYSDLLARYKGNGQHGARQNGAVQDVQADAVALASPAQVYTGAAMAPGMGIDIEEIAAMPRTNDFRKEAFYKMNFTPSEIAYCVLQPDAYASFAGLFTAKEAIVKADGSLRQRSFNTIGISHSEEGKPLYPGFHLSISHAGAVAVAVALVQGAGSQGMLQAGNALREGAAPSKKGGSGVWLSWLAIVLSLVAIILIFTR